MDHSNVGLDATSSHKFDASVSLEDLRHDIANFAEDRDWNQYHTPRNLVLALVGEVGELSEIFQWRGEVPPGLPEWSDKDKTHLGEEMSDVLLYLIRLADRCGIDLATAVKEKLVKNARKYPADKVRGSSKKYNEYDQKEAGEGAISSNSAELS